MASKVIDVSNNNGVIDYEAVKADGVVAVIIKATEGSKAGTNFVDPDFVKNVEGFNAVGIQTSAYHYFHGVSENDAQAEAELFLESLAKVQLTGSVFCDVEDENLNSDPQELTKFVNAFFDHMEKNGYKEQGIYSGSYFLDKRLVAKELNLGLLWVAAYNNKGPGIKCDLWQHTSKGKVKGINGYVDMSVSYTNKIGHIKKAKQLPGDTVKKTKVEVSNDVKTDQKLLNQHGAHLVVDGIAGPKTEAAIKVFQHDHGIVVDGVVGPKTLAALKGQASYYTVKSGDTLIGIAGAHHVSVDSIAKLNHLNNPDKIYPGQKLQLPATGAPTSHKRYVTVQKGDSLSKIAANAHLSLSDILKLNSGINHPDIIYPGQKIRVK